MPSVLITLNGGNERAPSNSPASALESGELSSGNHWSYIADEELDDTGLYVVLPK